MVGKEEGSASVNLKKSQDDFQKKLERKFRDIQKYADSLQSHTHPCVSIVGCETEKPTISPLLPPVDIPAMRRSLVFNNATQEEQQRTINIIKETLSSSNNSEVDNVLLELMLSDESLRSAVLGPVVEKFSQKIVETETEGGHQHDLSHHSEGKWSKAQWKTLGGHKA